jgi:hypothetical protein
VIVATATLLRSNLKLERKPRMTEHFVRGQAFVNVISQSLSEQVTKRNLLVLQDPFNMIHHITELFSITLYVLKPVISFLLKIRKVLFRERTESSNHGLQHILISKNERLK